MIQQEKRKDGLDKHWHLDRKVPMAIIFAIILQTIYFTIFLTKLDSRVANNETKIAEMSTAYKNMAEIKVHQEYLRDDIREIKRFLRDDVEWIKPKNKGGK